MNTAFAGSTYYVFYTGDDANSGTTITAPFLTLAKALTVANSGSDIIQIAAGAYY